MGYHRPVSSFNIGKKGEHAERTPFRETARRSHDRRSRHGRAPRRSPWRA